MQATNLRRMAAVAVGGALALSLAACGSSSNNSPSGSGTTGGTDWASAQSAAAGGGMDALIAAAKKEGALNVIALPPTWANYGYLISTFTKKYGIKITSENPNGSSGDEMNALASTKGQASAPDVVDVGNSYALTGATSGAFAPYKVATWNDIPATYKDAGGLWYADYGGYISIGCKAAAVGGKCPTTLKALDNPAYKGKVALDGNPTSANAAFEAVFAAALANGGSATNIAPGIAFFKKLNSEGIFNKTGATQATIQSGATPIVVDWDYLNSSAAGALKKANVTWTVTIPSDGLVSNYYDQAINVNAPHPAAARLWEEFLYSQAADAGQNGFMAGFARPIELPAMLKNGSGLNAHFLAPVTDANPFNPTPAQVTTAKNAVTAGWSAAVQ